MVALPLAPLQAAVFLNPGFASSSLPRNDDGFTGLVPIGFNINFFGNTYSGLYVNNNGNVTFNSGLSTFTPFGLGPATQPIIAPFFADVDTRGLASDVVRYGSDSVGGRSAFGVNWIDVGYFPAATDKLNQFQLVLVDRSDFGAGDFDIYFNYGNILWETGSASGGSNGFGGASATAGYSNGSGSFYQVPGSLVPGSFLGANGLSDSSIIFNVRNGAVTPQPPTVSVIPEPSTSLPVLVLIALPTLFARTRRLHKKAA